MCETVSKELCTENIRTIALRTIDERYQGHLQIYTDGSKMDSSTSAAIWIPEVEHQNNWKLQNGDILSIMTAELFGIKKALEWVALNEVLMPKKDIVILTDSLSSLQTIENPSSSSHLKLANSINKIAEILHENGCHITLQWVAAHTGLTGNECADRLAKQAHSLVEETHCPLGKEDVKRIVKKAKNRAWQTKYDLDKEEHDLHIASIKPTIGHWTWASFKHRAVETAVARLRIGHTELNGNLFRFNQMDNPNCTRCQTPETIEHYLLTCRRYSLQRRKMITALNKEGIPNIDMKTLLGGAQIPAVQQQCVAAYLEAFIRETKRMNGMA